MCARSTGFKLHHHAVCGGGTVVEVGTAPPATVPKIICLMRAIMKEAKAAKAKDPQNKGHQTNPAYALSALQAAVVKVLDDQKKAGGGGEAVNKGDNVPSVHAAGGFTDVGRHTGSEPRDTAWPLVREVWRVSGRWCVGV